MHLVCLGVVKKMIVNSWVYGKIPGKLPFLQLNNISNSLLSQVKNVPKKITRKPRSLNEANRWKAVEFSLFILY